jgi:hypothetical protein
MSKRKSDAEKIEAIERLLRTVEPGDTVYTIARHVSRSGMQREISLVAVDRSAIVLPVESRDGIAKLGREALTTIDYWAARALGYRIGTHGGIVVGGCGMDMGFLLVYNLGRTLWPHGTDKPHGRRNGQPDSEGGYALKHGWL